jgi:hypothetical protein
MDFDSLYKAYLTEFTVADAGLAGDADFDYNSGDTYASGDARVPKVLGKVLKRKSKKKRKKKINENTSIEVYRGTTSHGNKNLGTQSKSIQDKLVGALGPNYTDNEDIGNIFKRGAGAGGQLLKKNVNGKILTVNDYNDIIRLYAQYQKLMTPGIVNLIKSNTGSDQLKYIQLAASELRDILRSNGYSWIKSPFAVSDASYFRQKGLEGSIYIDLG